MTEKEELIAKLEQNQNDRQKLTDEGASLLKQIEGLEVTYSIGDRFTVDYDTSRRGKRLLISLPAGKIGMANMFNGTIMSNHINVGNLNKITSKEFGQLVILSSYTRYWDSRKGIKV